MINFRFYLREYKDNSPGVIWVSFYLNRQKVNFSTKVRCNRKHWDADKMCVRTTDRDHQAKNSILENVRGRIHKVEMKYYFANKRLSRDTFFREYNRPDDYATFFEFVEKNKNKIDFGNELTTNYTHQTVIQKVRQFAPDLTLDDITEEWLNEFYFYLRKELGNNENTSYKNMAVIKKYVLAAFRMGYIVENPFANWHIKRGTPSYVYLTEAELKKLMDAYLSGQFDERHHRTLEFFLFMCFSSLHVTDARNLHIEQFTDDSFVYYRVKTRNVKPEPIIVPVSETLRMILHNVVGTRRQGRIFTSLPADQTMNRYLKDIAAELEIKKPITHKTGRHTFATFFLAKTKDITALKEILGHSSLSETLIYAHVLDESKQEGIKCFNAFVD